MIKQAAIGPARFIDDIGKDDGDARLPNRCEQADIAFKRVLNPGVKRRGRVKLSHDKIDDQQRRAFAKFKLPVERLCIIG